MKKAISILLAVLIVSALIPGALAIEETFDNPTTVYTADALADAVSEDATYDLVTLGSDITISSTIYVRHSVTIDGSTNKYELDYTGIGNALEITYGGAVKLKNMKITADEVGNVNGPFAVSITTSAPNVVIDNCTIKAYTRGINFYPAGGCTGGALEVKNSEILNSRISDYESNCAYGDTRGIALYDVKQSTITISNSQIKGFGYSINTSGNTDSNNVRAADNTFNISHSDIWGWCVLNIWTIGNEFNFTNCDLRGINPSTGISDSFSVIVENENIFGNVPVTDNPNVFSFTGGSISATATAGSQFVDETLFRLDEDYQSVFKFYQYYNPQTFTNERVNLYCDRPFSAFVCTYENMTGEGLDDWAEEHLTGAANTLYNYYYLTPSVTCYIPAVSVMA